MSLTKRLVILGGLVGLLFYNATEAQLWAAIVDYQLSWYKLAIPLAWGVILGALVSLVGLRSFQRWLKPISFIAISVLTLGLTGSAAVFAAHQIADLMLPPMQLAATGLGIYLFGYSYARFNAASDRKSQSKRED